MYLCIAYSVISDVNSEREREREREEKEKEREKEREREREKRRRNRYRHVYDIHIHKQSCVVVLYARKGCNPEKSQHGKDKNYIEHM